MSKLPRLSIVVVVHRMSRQADLALRTLSAENQKHVSSEDYELVVVENASEDELGEARAVSHGGNVRYFRREEPGVSPVPAANFGVGECRADYVGLFLDGAHLVTPRLVEHALLARDVAREPVVAVPTYHLGSEPQHVSSEQGYDERAEAALVSNARALEDGYQLFEIACPAPGQEKGFLFPFRDAAGVFFTRGSYERIGGLDPRFDLPGGGAVGAYLFQRLSGLPEAKLVVLAGEGAFHQFHHGVTTSFAPDRDARLAEQNRNYESVTGVKLGAPAREPLLLGPLQGRAAPFVLASIDWSTMYHSVRSKKAPRESRPEGALGGAATPEHAGARPKLSIIVVVFRIPRQADNTIYSLSAHHQRNVSEDDYEILVVENASDAVYGEARARSHGKNVRYFLRDEPGVSPVPAVDFAFGEARAPVVGLMIDGAHMVSPRLIEHALAASRILPCPIISVPAHHLGQVEHHKNRSAGYDEHVEEELLAASGWKEDGYALFGISCWSGANYSGFLCPAIESGCLFATREAYASIGYADPRFDGPGGGLVNQDVYARLCRVPGSRLVVLGGEGTFHQFHGGVSTSEVPDRDTVLRALEAQHRDIRGQGIVGYDREPLLFGVMPPAGHAFFKESVVLGRLREPMCRDQGRAVWPND